MASISLVSRDSSSQNPSRAWKLEGLAVGIPLLACWWCFSELAGYPTNDDPFYGRPAQILADESRFQTVTQAGELSASSVAHVLIGGGISKLLGFSYRALFLAVILQLWLAGWALYAWAREEGCARGVAWLWGSVFVVNPLCFAHAFTFMTDAPAMSWGVFSLYFYRHGLRQLPSASGLCKWLVLGSVSVGVAFWMRQTHILYAAFPVISLSLWWYRGQLHLRRWCWGMLASLLPALMAVLLFESGWLVFGDGLWGDKGRLHVVAPQSFDWYQTAINIYGLGLLLGFLLLPGLPVLLHRSRIALPFSPTTSPTVRWRRVAAIVGVLWLVPLVATKGRACLTSATGSVIANAHFGPVFLSDFEMSERWGDMGDVRWPNWVWVTLTVAAIVNWAVLISRLLTAIAAWKNAGGEAIGKDIATRGLVATTIPIILVILSVRTGVQDRYWMLLLPVVFALATQLAARTGGRAGWLAVGLLLAQLTLSIVFARDFLTWNQTRWQQVETWLSQGMLAEEIDAGRDINAWFRSAEDYQTLPRPGDTTTWWSGRAKVALAVGPRPGWTEIQRLTWRAWATGGMEHQILVLQREPEPRRP